MQTNSTMINLYLKSLILTDKYKRARLKDAMPISDATACQIGGLVPVENREALALFIARQSRFVVSNQHDETDQLFSSYVP